MLRGPFDPTRAAEERVLEFLRGYAQTKYGGDLWQACGVVLREMRSEGWPNLPNRRAFYRSLKGNAAVLERRRAGEITLCRRKSYRGRQVVQPYLVNLPIPPTAEEQLAFATRLATEHMVKASETWSGADPAISVAVVRRRLAVHGWPLLPYPTLLARLRMTPEFIELREAGALARSRLGLRRAIQLGPKLWVKRNGR